MAELFILLALCVAVPLFAAWRFVTKAERAERNRNYARRQITFLGWVYAAGSLLALLMVVAGQYWMLLVLPIPLFLARNLFRTARQIDVQNEP